MKIKGFYILTRRSIARMIAILGVVLGSLYIETSAESNVLSRRVEDAQVELISLKRRLPEDSSRTQLPDVQYLEFKSVYLEAKRYRKEHGNPEKSDATGRVPPRHLDATRKSVSVSAYAGMTVAGFSVDGTKLAFKCTNFPFNGRSFELRRKADWNLVDQIISAASNCRDDYYIRLSAEEYNALSHDGKLLARLCVEREVRKGDRNRKYTGLARLKKYG